MLKFLLYLCAIILLTNLISCCLPEKTVSKESLSPTPVSEKKCNITFDEDEIISSNVSDRDKKLLMDSIISLHSSWLEMNSKKFLSLLTPDVIRMSQSGKIQYDAKTVEAELPVEWIAFEKANGIIAVSMDIKNVTFNSDGNNAEVCYWIELSGGNRWDFDDLCMVYEIFIRDGKDRWKLKMHTDSWSLSYDYKNNKPSSHKVFSYDWVYPVKDMARAINFYKPLMGEPEAVTENRASFNLRGSRFILDKSDIGGFVKIDKGLPNGYAIFYIDNLSSQYERLKKPGVKFLTGIKNIGSDRYIVGEDISGNIFLLMERSFIQADGNIHPEITLNSSSHVPPDVLATIKGIMSAWLKTDSEGLLSYISQNGQWFDDMRSRNNVMASGKDKIKDLLVTCWKKYDRSNSGLAANMEIQSLKSVTVGKMIIVTYLMKLNGFGNHPFKESALVTHILDQSGKKVSRTFIVSSNITGAMVKELDYSAYPVTDLKGAEKFYREKLGLGSPYHDEEWFGFWSNNPVFGVYTASMEEDKIPRPHMANGYASFLILSTEDVYNHLKKSKSEFPVIPAINNKSGIDEQPGYNQIFTTDSEGNCVLFTGYTGK